MSLIRAILQFLKTWFLPTPAHDDPRFADAQPADVQPLNSSATAEPTQDFHDGLNNDLDDDDGDLDPPDPDYPKKVPMHPVAEPEGAEERASRSSGGSNPFSE